MHSKRDLTKKSTRDLARNPATYGRAADNSKISRFTLQQTSGSASRQFLILELNGDDFRHRAELLLPHRKDFYFFFLVRKGTSQHWIDFINYEVRPGHLYFTLPHQIHLKEKTTPVKGTLLAFSEEFLITEEEKNWKKLPILQNPDDRHELKIDAEAGRFLDNLFAQMLTEYNQEKDWSTGILQNFCRAFLLYTSRLYCLQFNTTPSSSGSRALLRRMKELINEQYHRLHQVSDYARLLHISPGHLNDTVREYTGRTATTLIQERIILEAKRALAHADLSVKEIGHALGFEDPAYFNRFFKRITGETPLTFRNRMQ